MTAPAVRRLKLTLAETRPGYPAPGSAPQAMVDYVTQLLQDGEEDAVARYKQATRLLLYADGRQHIDYSNKEKSWLDAPVAEGRVQVTMNRIRPILRSRMQRMVSAELAWRAVPRSNDHEERDRATVATNFLAHRWAKGEMDAKVRAGLWLAFCSAGAFLKSFWNPDIGPLTKASVIIPHLNPEARLQRDEAGNVVEAEPELLEYLVDAEGNPIHDEAGNPVPDAPDAYKYRPGDTDTAVRSIFNVRVNPDAWGLESAEGFRWLLDAELVPISVVKEKYGDRARRVQTVQGMSTSRNYQRIVRSLGPNLGRSMANELVAGRGGRTLPDKEQTLLVEYWEAPSDPFQAGRLVVVAGNELLYPLGQGEEGLPQGFVPYVGLYDERRAFDAYTRGVTTDLVGPQNVINKQWGAILEDMFRQGIGQWIMWGLPGISDQITNTDGAHIVLPTQTAYANRPIGDMVQRVPPGRVSADRWRLIEKAEATMFDIGAFHEIQRGQMPPGVDSGIAVQLLQEAENAQLHDPVRGLKSSLIQWARHQLKLARWGYGENEERWIPMKRPDLGYLVESVVGADLPDPDEIDIDLEGFRPTSTAAMRAEIKEAMAQGWMDPRQGLLLMDLGRGVEGAFESQTRHYARARSENLAFEKAQFKVIPAPEGTPTAGMPAFLHPDGGAFLLPADDNHETHIEVHQEIALDDSKPIELRTAVLLHIAEHRAMLQLALAAAAAQEAAPSGKPGVGSAEGA